MSKKVQLFDDENENEERQQNKLIVNKTFAQSFENRKKREFVDRAKAQFGNDYKGEKQDDESSSSEEDENGELINENLSSKFLQTLAKIRYKVPEIYDPEKYFFDDEDYEQEESEELTLEQKNLKKKKTIKDVVREQALDKMNKGGDDDVNEDDSDSEFEKNKKQFETPIDEQNRIKQEFQKAAKIIKNSNKKQKSDENDDEDNDEDEEEELFQIKKKTQKELEEDEINIKKVLKNVEKKDKKIIKEFWQKEDTQLDDTDKFLRNYILKKQWMDRENDLNSDEDLQADEQLYDQQELFEVNYNFRYQEPGGDQITTHGRMIPDSLRQKSEKRKDKRKETKSYKQEQMVKLQEDIKMLKNIKKEEIQQKFLKIVQTGGLQQEKLGDIEALQKLVDEEEFDEEKFNQQMQEQFNDEYYSDIDEDEDELIEYEQEIKNKQKLELQEQPNQAKDQKDHKHQEDKNNIIDVKPNIPIAHKQNITEKEIDQMIVEEEEDGSKQINNIFWYCDYCKKGINANQMRWDCQQCLDYTLCKTCNDAQIHQHKMKRFIVPANCAPPSDEQIHDILQTFKICQKCNMKLNEYCNYYKLKANKSYILCDECYDSEHLHNKDELYKLVKASKIDVEEILENDPSKLKEVVNDEIINKLVNEYYSLDFEDVIAGGLKTRFNYIDVKPISYGLSNEDLVYSDPKLLNSYISQKKLAPYREDEGDVRAKVLKNKSKLKTIKKSAKNVRQIIKKENQFEQELKEKTKMLSKLQEGTKQYKNLQKQIKILKRNNQNKNQVLDFKDEIRQNKSNLIIEEEDQDNADNKYNLKLTNNRLKSFGLDQE